MSHSGKSEHGFITFSNIRIKYCLLFQSISIHEIQLSIISWTGLYKVRYGILTFTNLVVEDDKYAHVRKNLSETDCIKVDEISMLSAKLFEQLEMVCSVVSGNNKVFGGNPSTGFLTFR